MSAATWCATWSAPPLAGVSGSWLLTLVAGLSGIFGFVLVAYVFFVVVYAVLVSLGDDRPAVKDAVMTVLMASMAVLALGALGHRRSSSRWPGDGTPSST